MSEKLRQSIRIGNETIWNYIIENTKQYEKEEWVMHYETVHKGGNEKIWNERKVIHYDNTREENGELRH